jgi:EF hand
MLILRSIFIHQKLAMVSLCLLLGANFSIFAGAKDNTSSNSTDAGKTQDADNNDLPPKKSGPISIEDSIRLRRDLDEYSRTVDPAHVQIEERRRLMYQRVQSRFVDADRDNDGSISREEALDSLPQVARHFNQVDLNGDGVITLDELEALQARILGQRPTIVKIETQAEPDTSTTKTKNKDVMLSNRKPTL